MDRNDLSESGGKVWNFGDRDCLSLLSDIRTYVFQIFDSCREEALPKIQAHSPSSHLMKAFEFQCGNQLPVAGIGSAVFGKFDFKAVATVRTIQYQIDFGAALNGEREAVFGSGLGQADNLIDAKTLPRLSYSRVNFQALAGLYTQHRVGDSRITKV